MPQIASNFTYLGKKFLDDRQSFNDITAMTSFSVKSLPEGFIAYVKSEDKYYKFNSTNDFDAQLGYWKEYNGGTGSSTDEKVKLNNTSESKYLEELIDNSTIEVDVENGVIKAVGLDGLETTVATLNYVKNLDKDIMSYLSSIGNPMAFKGVVADDDALTAITDMVSGDTYIVQSSASNGNKTMTFIYNGVEFVPMAETVIEVRDFTTNPIDLATETTGVLHKSKIDSAIARLADVLDKATYRGSADGIVKQADKITGLTSTISVLNEAVTNSHKHTNKSVLDKIVSNGIGEGFLADNGMYLSFLHIGATSPNYDSQLWVDNTDSTSLVLKIYDGTNWVEVSGSSNSKGEDTSSIKIDTAMSDTSTNPVQNKVIKDYVDNKAVTVSTTSDNAIENKADGIYVKKTKISTDKDNALSEKSNGLYVKDLSGEINKINYAQKTVNEKSDYIYLQADKTNLTLSANTVLPFNIKADGNMEVVSENNSVKLTANRTYKISCDIFVDKSGYCFADLYDLTNNTVLATFAKAASNYNTSNSDSSLQYIYTPSTDCEIQIKIQRVTGESRMYNMLNNAYFIVEEIGKAIAIDPLDYVNENEGIEDTPVGHIMACMSNSAPKHYLICDGTEYNIADYPYLADHFKTEFGKVNYFGGDGVTKFAVPDLRAEFLRGFGIATRNTGKGADVGVHQDGTSIPLTLLLNNTLYMYYGDYSQLSQTEQKNNWILPQNEDIVLGENQPYQTRMIGTTSAISGANGKVVTRPTNTSVLYCIKATPTYFMKNVYNGQIYSTEEKVVGRWIDGKPIYQKTFIYNSLSTTASWTKLEDFPNVDTVVDIKHIIGNVSGWAQSTDGLFASGDDRYRLQFAYNNDAIMCLVGSDFNNCDAHITMQYTKTTDSPSDVLITPNSSCNCVSYTDEEVSTEIDTVLGGTE